LSSSKYVDGGGKDVSEDASKERDGDVSTFDQIHHSPALGDVAVLVVELNGEPQRVPAEHEDAAVVELHH